MPGKAGTFSELGLGAAQAEIVPNTITLIAIKENRFIRASST
jgi:hypothetical protein